MSRLAEALRVCLEPDHLLRTGTIALVVGTWLTLYNLGDLLLAGEASLAIAAKILLNYLTPFVVANWGLLSRRTEVAA